MLVKNFVDANVLVLTVKNYIALDFFVELQFIFSILLTLFLG